MKKLVVYSAAVFSLCWISIPASAQSIKVGHLVDYTGPTSSVGKPYGEGVADALNYINAHGGVKGRKFQFNTVDYAYNVAQAVPAYKHMIADGVVAIQGWGTSDTEALVSFVAKDKVPYFSASYSGHLTDPTGKNPNTKKAAPYNFFYGASYSDGCRGLVAWAARDWKKRGNSGQPKFIHMGANHPYALAPKAACESYAKELGFQIMPTIVYSLSPGDFKAQCLSLKESGANYAFLGNTSGSNISLLKSCETVGVKTRFMANIFGFDEGAIKAAGHAGEGVVVVESTPTWGELSKGASLMRSVSKVSDPTGKEYRLTHYLRGVCSVFFMKEAMEIAAGMPGGITGPNIEQAMYKKKNWVPKGLEGVCLPSTWTATDHRGTTTVLVDEAHFANGAPSLRGAFKIDLPRRPEWLGE